MLGAPARLACNSSRRSCLSAPLLWAAVLHVHVAAGEECAWYCKDWCRPGVLWCHRLSCDPADSRDCPGSSCGYECGPPVVGAAREEPQRRRSFWVPVIAASALLTCCMASCIWMLRSRLEKAKQQAAKLVAERRSLDSLEAGQSISTSIPCCSTCSGRSSSGHGCCACALPDGHATVTHKEDRQDRVYHHYTAGVSPAGSRSSSCSGSKACGAHDVCRGAAEGDSSGSGAGSDTGSTRSGRSRVSQASHPSRASEGSRQSRATRGERRRRDRDKVQPELVLNAGSSELRKSRSPSPASSQSVAASSRDASPGGCQRSESGGDGCSEGGGKPAGRQGRQGGRSRRAGRASGRAGSLVEGSVLAPMMRAREVRDDAPVVGPMATGDKVDDRATGRTRSRSEPPAAHPQIRRVVACLESKREAVNELRRVASELPAGCSSAVAEQTRTRAQALDADLVEEMVALDSLIGLGQEDRVRRKNAIASIEAMLEVVDGVKVRCAEDASPSSRAKSIHRAHRDGCQASLSERELSEEGFHRLANVLQQLETVG